MKSEAWGLGLVAWTILGAMSALAEEPPPVGTRRALIVVGLPGDPAHETLFRETSKRWKDWLTGPLGFPTDGVRILSGRGDASGLADAPATRESIGREAEALRMKSNREDRVWVFVLGHANLDDGHAFLHLPGQDLRDDEFAALFRDLSSKEQVFWLTSPASGAFLGPLSRPGRIVVAATGRSGEVNETEFPHVLAEVSRKSSRLLDLDKDGQVSILELFQATVEAVEARFRADERAPTEHANLDDDGDGVASEPKPGAKPKEGDGFLSSRTFLTIEAPKIDPKPSPRSENGTVRIPPPAR